MITTTIALLFSLTVPHTATAQSSSPSAGKLISDMFARYAQAKTVVGTISMTQSAKGVSVHTRTQLQFERPSMLYLVQDRDGSMGGHWVVTSDGTLWSYDRPMDRDPSLMPPREVEMVSQHNNTMTVPDFLDAASHSIGDVNAMLIASMSSKTRLQALVAQWTGITYKGKVTLGTQQVHYITGKYRLLPGQPPSGEFELYISEAGDFLKYAIHQRMEFPKAVKETIEIDSVWESDLKVDAQPNRSLFKVVR